MRTSFLLILGLFILLSCSLHIKLGQTEVKVSNGYRVHNLDTGLNYATIQEAINAPYTFDGHTILLDLYVFEEHIVINKSIKLHGALNLGLPWYPDKTTIKGDGTGTIVTIKAPNVTLNTLEIINGTNGIILEEAHDSILWGLRICDNIENGLFLLGSRNCTLGYIRITNNRYNFGVEGLELEDFSHTIISSTVNAKPIHYLINEHEVSLIEDSGYIAAINCTTIAVQNQNLTNNRQGILLAYTKNSVIRNANINNNLYGIYIHNSENNIIYHNNFVNNTYQVKIEVSSNSWNDDVEGNFWNNYTGIDVNHDGIGDTPYRIDENNTDNYPLIGMFSDFKVTSEYHVQTVCDSTLSDFQLEDCAISFNVTGIDGTAGFCRICIPKSLLAPPHTVVINDGTTEVLYFNDTIYDNGTHRWIYFAYEHSTHEVVIVPEFPSFLILPLFMIATLLAVIAYRRKRSPK